MKSATDGLPVVGDRSKELGVRVSPNPSADVDVDPNTNLVILKRKGMSVVANWRLLPPHLIPKRLVTIIPMASGPNVLRCYRRGTGPFAEGILATGLELVLKPRSTVAGNVVPVSPVGVSEFQRDLAATRTDWVEDES
jgi:hypothetical protein